MPASKATQEEKAWAAWAQGKGPKPGTAKPSGNKQQPKKGALPGDVRAIDLENDRRTTGGSASGGSGLAGGGPPPPPSGAGGGSSAAKLLTPKEIAAIRKRQEQELREHLSGPWTQESILGQYNGTVASVLGSQHPKAEQFAQFGMNQKMDADTFSSWLRARPEYQQTENYRKAKGDYLSVLAEVFGYR